MAAYQGEQFDVILTDPPYGIGADTFGDSGGKAAGAHSYDDTYENWKRIIPEFANQSYRITKPQAHLYAFCDIDRFHEFKRYLDDAGWNCFRTPLIWYKSAGSRLPWVDFGPQRKYEIAIYANKGRRPVNTIIGDVLSYNSDENLGHQAQKPVALYADLLRRSVAPGNLVLDPFAGSGTIFPAAHEVKCRAVGIESVAEHYALCLKRLEKLKAQGELPV
jgi:DNA modification methylase